MGKCDVRADGLSDLSFRSDDPCDGEPNPTPKFPWVQGRRGITGTMARMGSVRSHQPCLFLILAQLDIKLQRDIDAVADRRCCIFHGIGRSVFGLAALQNAAAEERASVVRREFDEPFDAVDRVAEVRTGDALEAFAECLRREPRIARLQGVACAEREILEQRGVPGVRQRRPDHGLVDLEHRVAAVVVGQLALEIAILALRHLKVGAVGILELRPRDPEHPTGRRLA